MFSATEKYVALVDAADRCREFNKNPQHHPEHHYGYKNHNNTSNNVYEGSITEAELRQQATLWGLLWNYRKVRKEAPNCSNRIESDGNKKK